MSKKKRDIFVEAHSGYKPFSYPEFFDMYKQHDVELSWFADEIDLSRDATDWTQVPEVDKYIITQILKGFTQSDVAVSEGYSYLIRALKHTEIRMCLTSFANRENVHILSYSLLLETLGFDDSMYQEYKFVPSINSTFEFAEKAKIRQFHEYLEICGGDEYQATLAFRKAVAFMLAVYAGGLEGVSLFSQFAVLFNYARQNKFAGMAKIVEYSSKDEQAHLQGNAAIFKHIIKENREIWNDDFKRDIYSAFREIASYQFEYIDYVFATGNPKDLDKETMKEYVKYMVDTRLKQFGLKPEYGVKENPLPWFEEMLNTSTMTNFFDAKAADYSKMALTGDWGEARNKMKEIFGEKV
jgi:ribonucleoside-diphosphate reductase beta chain